MQQQKDSVSNGVTTPDLSSIQTRHKHCGARLTTEHQAKQCQQSHCMELWSKELYLGFHFVRMLTCRKHAETTALKRKKGLSVLKTMAAKGIKERHLLEMNSRSPHGEAAFFSTLRVPGVFFFINDLFKTSSSGICRSPDPRHLNVPELVKNI